MKTIIRPLDPQPVLANTKPPGRWIWGPTAPITDMCGPNGDLGTAVVSWWNDRDVVEALDQHCPNLAQHCPIERPKDAEIEWRYDGERWLWFVSITERAWARFDKQRSKSNKQRSKSNESAG